MTAARNVLNDAGRGIMNGIMTGALAGAACLALAGAPALAQTPSLLGQDQEWAAYSAEMNGAQTCYALSQPKSQQPSGVRRGDVYFFVTFRPQDKIANQISVVIGYPFREGSRVTLEIGSESFSLFTKDDKAWIEDIGEQNQIIEAMKKGSTMTVRGTSSRGTNTVDSYSLLGVTAALGRAEKGCSG